MRIVVFARPVQNPAIRIESGATRVLEELQGYEPIPNPMDELALEVALSLREKASLPVRIMACSVGREPSRKVLTEFLACGADEAVCIEEAGWEPDGAVVAACLSEFHSHRAVRSGPLRGEGPGHGRGRSGPHVRRPRGNPLRRFGRGREVERRPADRCYPETEAAA